MSLQCLAEGEAAHSAAQEPACHMRRAESAATSVQLIEQQHPEILDLARSGAAALLVTWQ